MAGSQIVAYWIAAGLFAAAVASGWHRVFAGRWRLLAATGLGALTLAIAVRWVVSGHPPLFGTFENALASAWFIAACALIADRRLGDRIRPGAIRLLLAWAPLTLVYGAFFNREPFPLTISERNLLVDVHAAFAWVAYAALLLVSMVSAQRLLSRDGGDSHADDVAFRGLGLGFAFLTLMMAVGAIYSFMLFADWYRWEVVETLTAATWLAYGSVIHARLLFDWKGRAFHIAALCVLPLLVATFWVWSIYAGTYHHFDITVLKAQ